MSAPLFLELLEDRMLLSGMNMGATLVVPDIPAATTSQFRPYPGGTGSQARFVATVLDGMQTATAIPAENRVDGADLLGQRFLGSTDAEDFRHREDMMEDHRHLERDSASLLASIATSGSAQWGFDNNRSEPQSTFRETSVGFSDRLPTGSGTGGQSSPFSVSAVPEASQTLDQTGSADGTAELTAPGPFADGVILDAWQGGLPLPRTELVPVAERDLTIIAAYLVGTPSSLRTADGATANATEFGLTDFIVGHPDSQSERPVLRTSERVTDASSLLSPEQRQLVPDREPIMPASCEGDPVESGACVGPQREENGGSQGEGPNVDLDEEC